MAHFHFPTATGGCPPGLLCAASRGSLGLLQGPSLAAAWVEGVKSRSLGGGGVAACGQPPSLARAGAPDPASDPSRPLMIPRAHSSPQLVARYESQVGREQVVALCVHPDRILTAGILLPSAHTPGSSCRSLMRCDPRLLSCSMCRRSHGSCHTHRSARVWRLTKSCQICQRGRGCRGHPVCRYCSG